MCHTDAPLWSAREIASMALPAEQERHAKNVWHIALRKLCSHEKKSFRDFHVRTLKMVRNFRKIGLEKQLKRLYRSQNYSVDRIKNWCVGKMKVSLFQYSFCRNWLGDWDFMTFWIFWKMSVKTLVAANFERSS